VNKTDFLPKTIKMIRFIIAAVLASSLLIWPSPALGATINVNSAADTVADDGVCTLREAVTAANTNMASGSTGNECTAGSSGALDTITFAAALNGTPITLSGAAGDDVNLSGDLDILDGGDLTIQGNGLSNTIIDGGGIDRIFHNCHAGGCTSTVTIANMSVRNGSVTGSPGGGIFNKGTLTVQNCNIGLPSNGNSADYGGGIYHTTGSLTLDGATVRFNNAGTGAGIYNGYGATLIVQNNSKIWDNTATGDGGGIFNSAGSVTIDGSLIQGNKADNGGGIHNWEVAVGSITRTAGRRSTAQRSARTMRIAAGGSITTASRAS